MARVVQMASTLAAATPGTTSIATDRHRRARPDRFASLAISVRETSLSSRPAMSTPGPYARAPRLPEGEALRPEMILGDGPEPFELEIGPGRGGFVFERLEADPRVRLVGFEVRL